ncbi:MAG: ribosome biogenesis GTPase YlqF [Candidatus Gastranaerophilales bacterium]|nr:ribosome biogenesis GTPase YlqF [Candidatus Gastranaerophilales bacterium]
MKKDKLHIHWYPGHIAKAERALKEKLNLVDVVIEVLDARLPISSSYNDIEKLLGDKPRLLLLNKSDLVSSDEIKSWVNIIQERENCPVLTIDTKTNRNFNIIEKKVLELSEPRIQALMAKGLLRRPARVVVVGLPNVGKSSIINKLTKSSKTKTGAKAGVTRQQQWVRINPNIDLLDTPGIIPMKQEDQERAKKLAFVNSVSENAYSPEIVAKELISLIIENPRYTTKFKEYYNVVETEELSLENISASRNWVVTGGEPDIERTSQYVLRDFRDGKIGKFILDNIDEVNEK